MNTQLPILYHYVHCPFCVRVRMAAGYLKIPYESRVLPYNDETTPIALAGKKMLPIMQFGDQAINESLEIIRRLDEKKQLNAQSHYPQLDPLLDQIGKDVHSLAMPYWIWTAEFDENSRKYFREKKEQKRGPFSKLVKRRGEFISSLNQTLEKLGQELHPFYQSGTFTIADILISAHLWGMFVVPEFQFSDKIYSYLMNVKELCNFDYHEDFWRAE